MFENTRFEDLDGKKESKNNPELGQYWASLEKFLLMMHSEILIEHMLQM